MKKIFFLILLPVAILMFSACQPTIEDEIRQAFYESEYNEGYEDLGYDDDPDKIVIYHNFGKSNESYVVDIMPKPISMGSFMEIVDGVIFAYNVDYFLLVYNSGKLYRLGEAFDAGLIDHDNLVEIQKLLMDYIPG